MFECGHIASLKASFSFSRKYIKKCKDVAVNFSLTYKAEKLNSLRCKVWVLDNPFLVAFVNCLCHNIFPFVVDFPERICYNRFNNSFRDWLINCKWFVGDGTLTVYFLLIQVQFLILCTLYRHLFFFW